ncbi:excalibur calcium-binding domain-containing protein [Aureimonas psammosilenae]|jgi:hypothetical protein|uniref:excalibur calcium-binding domain-containing protein n=1 Tax=Aureimonas psammosilenae TaxID=2495496 RepID=UPI001F3AA293|nr:excalibur calcium-binding domain-containing protein [Aureimonas psammosilenae]
MLRMMLAAMISAGALSPAMAAPPMTRFEPALMERLQATPVASRRTCKSVSSCEEAVALWCGGYRRADGDGDGIPCENVCSSKADVDRIKAEIGCD